MVMSYIDIVLSCLKARRTLKTKRVGEWQSLFYTLALEYLTSILATDFSYR